MGGYDVAGNKLTTAEVLKWPDGVAAFPDSIKGNPDTMYTNANKTALQPSIPVTRASLSVSHVWPINAYISNTNVSCLQSLCDSTGSEYILCLSSV